MAPIPPPIGPTSFRGYRGDADLAGMLAVYNGARRADGVTTLETLQGFENTYRHLTNCDLATDTLLAQQGERIVGYARVTWWVEEATRDRVLLNLYWLLPEARGGSVAEAMLAWAETRLAEIARDIPHDGREFLVAYLDGGEDEREAVLRAAGYARTQTYAEMTRPLDLPIPDLPLPEGVALRPVTWDDGRALWEADQRAFRDHVGYSPGTEADYQQWLGFEHADPALWKVAFVGDAIAGQVLNYVNEPENAAFGRKRGWTEDIAVQREWRGRGVARALIAESMRMFRDMGMTEVALGVHTTNPTGAFRLYEGLGYRVVTTSWELRRLFPGPPPSPAKDAVGN